MKAKHSETQEKDEPGRNFDVLLIVIDNIPPYEDITLVLEHYESVNSLHTTSCGED